MKPQKTFAIIGILIMLVIPMVAAYSLFGDFLYRSPLDYLENEWVFFSIIFLIFFATIYYTLVKTLKNNPVAVIVAFGISTFISMAISRRGMFSGYGGDFDLWVLLIATLIAIAFLMRYIGETFGRWAAVLAVFLLWIVLISVDPINYLPYELASSYIFTVFYEILKSPLGLSILIVFAIIMNAGVRATIKDFNQTVENISANKVLKSMRDRMRT